MSSEPSEFIDTAKRILAAAVAESDYRAATSRAYYGALHEADLATPDAFSATDAERRSGSSHQAILKGLMGWGNSLTPGRSEARLMERILKRMKASRQEADYDLTTCFELYKASDVINLADEISHHTAEVRRKVSGQSAQA